MEDQEKLIQKVNEEASKAATEAVEATKERLNSVEKAFNEFKNIVENSKDKEETQTKLKELETKLNDIGFSKSDGDKLLEKMQSLENVMKAQGEKMATFNGGQQEEKESLGKLVKEALIKEGLIEEHTHEISKHNAYKFKDENVFTAKKGTKIELKAAVDMTTSNTFSGVETGYQTGYSMRDRLIPVINDMHALDFFSVTNISDKYFGVFVEKTYVDGADVKAEDTAAGQTSFLFDTVEYKVFKYNTHLHVSEEQMEDVDQIIQRINRLVPNRLKSKLDSYIFEDGGDNSASAYGMFVDGTNCTDFTPNTYSSTVADANIINVIGKMKLQALNSNYDVNMVGLHPTTIDEIEELKDGDKNSLKLRGAIFDDNGNLVRIKGLGIMRNKQIGTNEAVVFNMDAPEIGLRRGIEMIIGYDSDDLTTGMRTIVFSMRAAFGVNTPGAVIYSSDLAAATATIDSGT